MIWAVLLAFLSTVQSEGTARAPIVGTIKLDLAQPRSGGTLRVLVHSKVGELIESAAISPDNTFELFVLPTREDGTYILHVSGNQIDEYNTLLVLLQRGTVVGTYMRTNPLILPPDPNSGAWIAGPEIIFEPFTKTNYKKTGSQWTLRSLWSFSTVKRILQLTAIGFVVWFPHFIRGLPKDLREELMHEKEVDLGDPNAVAKALTGRSEASVGNPGPQR